RHRTRDTHALPPSSSSFLLYCATDHRHLPSFPTRRSSDLADPAALERVLRKDAALEPVGSLTWFSGRDTCMRYDRRTRSASRPRSEEHTSELQSRSDLVCRLLLEKKKK